VKLHLHPSTVDGDIDLRHCLFGSVPASASTSRQPQARSLARSWLERSSQLLHCRVFPNQLMRVVP
jgi:hypothetical protein